MSDDGTDLSAISHCDTCSCGTWGNCVAAVSLWETGSCRLASENAGFATSHWDAGACGIPDCVNSTSSHWEEGSCEKTIQQ